MYLHKEHLCVPQYSQENKHKQIRYCNYSLLEKFKFAQLTKKLSAFYKKRIFITVNFR